MKFIEEANQLTIKLEGAEQLWALKRRIQIPHYAIEQVNYLAEQPTMQDLEGDYFRFPGTSLPTVFLAGSYKKRGSREFWYVKLRETGLLTIDLKPETINYDRVRITCSPEVAQDITDWWREHK